jgi:hypothetical protein
VGEVKALILALALALAVPAPANAFCFSAFHTPKVEVQAPGQYPVQIRPAGSQKAPDSFCQTVMRASAITLVVQGIVIGAKVGLGVLTGVILF